MSKVEAIPNNENVPIIIDEFVLRLFIVALLAYLLGKLYVKYGRSLSNRQAFASNFLLLAVATMIIITLVKSSLALSLGLVGALSIVRYRTAIKEPEELTYLFIAITIGLGLGADQVFVTLVSFVAIALFIILKNITHKTDNFYTTLVVTDTTGNLKFEICNQIMQQSCQNLELRRMDNKQDFFEVVYNIQLKNATQLNQLADKLKSINEEISIQFLEA